MSATVYSEIEQKHCVSCIHQVGYDERERESVLTKNLKSSQVKFIYTAHFHVLNMVMEKKIITLH